MKMLLTPYVQRDLGVVLLRPGRDLLHYFTGRARLLIASEPAELNPLPSGLVPVASQHLAADPRLSSFFSNKRVLAAAGGINALVDWLDRSNECQWHAPADDYHDRNMSTLRYGDGAVRLCWHHEHTLAEQTLPALDDLATRNVADFILYRARTHFRFDENHQLSLPELCWWAVMEQVSDLLPDSVARFSLRLPPAEISTGPKKEADIVWERAPMEVINDYVEQIKPVLAVDIDPEPPAGFMLRPKMPRWESQPYLQWVKSQPCCCGCGRPADDPHHVIGYGFGGTGTKAGDNLTMPLTRECHDELHQDVLAWEAKHGSQVVYAAQTLDRAFRLGVIITINKRGAKV
ncbi:DUF968 domain-containing protein [Serratia fonticola]|uniref:DUF968 domain-containing protein n=1 Tax=Serratia fonticola TaxID=47917 RepID=A0AAJ2DAH1_SERFO|nr:DUF968 domain-containing protein [Serratia fonticola]MDQ9130327.1 DUF968 domain-containing protein [Serratia fonticola]